MARQLLKMLSTPLVKRTLEEFSNGTKNSPQALEAIKTLLDFHSRGLIQDFTHLVGDELRTALMSGKGAPFIYNARGMHGFRLPGDLAIGKTVHLVEDAAKGDGHSIGHILRKNLEYDPVNMELLGKLKENMQAATRLAGRRKIIIPGEDLWFADKPRLFTPTPLHKAKYAKNARELAEGLERLYDLGAMRETRKGIFGDIPNLVEAAELEFWPGGFTLIRREGPMMELQLRDPMRHAYMLQHPELAYYGKVMRRGTSVPEFQRYIDDGVIHGLYSTTSSGIAASHYADLTYDGLPRQGLVHEAYVEDGPLRLFIANKGSPEEILESIRQGKSVQSTNSFMGGPAIDTRVPGANTLMLNILDSVARSGPDPVIMDYLLSNRDIGSVNSFLGSTLNPSNASIFGGKNGGKLIKKYGKKRNTKARLLKKR